MGELIGETMTTELNNTMWDIGKVYRPLYYIVTLGKLIAVRDREESDLVP